MMKNYAIEDSGGGQRTENSVFEKELLTLQPTSGSPASPSILNLPPGSGKWRLIDNGTAGQHNSTSEARETIHATSTAVRVAGAVCFRKYTGRPLRGRDAIVVSTQDM